jgi:SsrA-binding protein
MPTKSKKASVSPSSIDNRRARYDYNILEDHEAGLALVGSEVKSLYKGRANLGDSYCRVINGELFLINMDIEPYENSTAFAHERRRDRKLLMHRSQIDTLERKSLEKGLTMVPLRVYFNARGRAKVRIGLARGRAQYDKRDQIARDETRREASAVRAAQRGRSTSDL